MRIGIVQMNSGIVKSDNLDSAKDLIQELADLGATLIMLPEYFNFLGPEAKIAENAEYTESSVSIDIIRQLAMKRKIYIHLGSFAEKVGDKIFNTAIVFNPAGEIMAKYRKIHLFDVEIPGGKKYLESATISPGHRLTTFTIAGTTFGMATCYDLRFPELFRQLSAMGAEVFLLPAAFTLQTGRDHWQLLLRARAVENLSWVVAANQCGPSPPDNMSYGRSMIIDPWGIVTAQAADGVRSLIADIDIDSLREIRKTFPVLLHRREDIFNPAPPRCGN